MNLLFKLLIISLEVLKDEFEKQKSIKHTFASAIAPQFTKVTSLISPSDAIKDHFYHKTYRCKIFVIKLIM